MYICTHCKNDLLGKWRSNGGGWLEGGRQEVLRISSPNRLPCIQIDTYIDIYMYKYVRTCIYIYIHMYTYIHIYICIHMYTYI